MSRIMPIGTTKGPGETAQEYLLITPDRGRTAKVGEFVYYETAVGGQPRRVLGRITGRQPVRLFPDGFLADPEVPPDQVAALIGYTEREYELFEVGVVVLGYYDETLGDFINPRLPPRAGTPSQSTRPRVRPASMPESWAGEYTARAFSIAPLGYSVSHMRPSAL